MEYERTGSCLYWGGGNQYLQVEMDAAGGTSYTLMGASELLSVPYAFYGGTAARLSGEMSAKSGPVVGLQGAGGVPSQTWSLFGNSNSNPGTDKLGTTDLADLVMVTNNLERLRITSNGDIKLSQRAKWLSTLWRWKTERALHTNRAAATTPNGWSGPMHRRSFPSAMW